MGSIIEKIKSFDIKKCTIFSLIVAILYIIVEISTSEYIDIQSIISSNIFVVGLIIYLFLILVKLKLKKGNIKVASCILIFSYINNFCGNFPHFFQLYPHFPTFPLL